MNALHRSALVVLGTGLLSLVSGGCAHDRILPVKTVCGDHRVTGDEECDTDSPGCRGCRIVTGFECPDNECRSICGDGLVVGNEECDPPDDITCDRSCKTAKRTGCTMDGYFIARQTNYARDTVLGQVQTSTNWYFYRFSQDGEVFTTEEALYCGLGVTGTVDISLDDGGYRALLYSTHQDGSGPHGPRHGRFTQNGDGCALSYDRWYLVRGVDDRFLPDDFSKEPALTDLTPLPYEADPLHPTGEHLAGATDDDGDGLPGLGLHVTGNLSGVRSAAQRDWNEVSPDPQNPIAPGAIEFTAISTYDNQESVLSVTSCPPDWCKLLLAGSAPAHDLTGHVTLRYLGKDLGDARVAEIASSAPGADADEDLATCARVRDALPAQPWTP